MSSNQASFYIGFNDLLASSMDKSAPISEKTIKKHKSLYFKKNPFSHRTYSLKHFFKKKFCNTSTTKEHFQETFDSTSHLLSLSEKEIFYVKNTSTTEPSTTIYKDKDKTQLKKNSSYTFLETIPGSYGKKMRKTSTFAGFKNIFKFSLKRQKKLLKTDSDDICLRKEEILKNDKGYLLTKEELLRIKRITKSSNDIDKIIPLSIDKWINIAKDYERRKIIKNNLRRTSNQSLDSGVTDSNTTISDSTTSKKQQSGGFDYISKALMAVSSNALTEHQNFFKWNFCKKIPDKEYVLAAIPCYESEDTTRNGFLYITPKYLAYTSSHSQCYFLLTDIQKINKQELEIDGNDFLEVILKNSTIYRFHGITDILSIYWLIYELKILKWDEYWKNKSGITRRIKSSMKLKSYKNYFKVKESVKKFKSLNKLTRDDDIDSCALLNKTEDTLKATKSSSSKKDQFLNGRTLQNNNKKSQIIKAYNSFTRKKQKIPFHDLNSVKTNESDQLSLSDLSSSIDREDTSSATNSCTISTSSPSINDGEKCFDVSENDEDSTKILFPVSCGCTEHVGKKHIDSTYNIPLDIFFQILFSSVPWYEQLKSYIATSSKEMAFFEKMNKANAEEWKNIDKNNKIYYRDVKFTMSFSQAMFSGKINVKEEQTLSPINNNYECGGKLVKKVFNTGVPMADSFYIEVTYCLTRYSEFQTHLQVHGNVVLRKQKGFFASIKSSFPFDTITQSGLSDHYSSLNRLLSLFSADKVMYNNLLEILAKNKSDQGIPITFKTTFINSIESDEVFKSESKLNVSTFEKKVCSKIYNEKSIDVDILNQMNEIIDQSIIKNNINLCSNKIASTVDSLNLKLDSLAKQMKLLTIIFGLSLVCQVFYILHVYIFS